MVSRENNTLAIQLSELASYRGDFAVDLMQAFAIAHESAILSTENEFWQKAVGNDGWGNNDISCNWGYGDPADNAGCRETVEGQGWGDTVHVERMTKRRPSTPQPAPGNIYQLGGRREHPG